MARCHPRRDGAALRRGDPGKAPPAPGGPTCRRRLHRDLVGDAAAAARIGARLDQDHDGGGSGPADLPPARLSFDSYQRLWSYQAGLPTYLVNSGGAALLTIVFCLVLTIPAGYALARFPVPGKEFLFVSCCSR